MSKMYAQALKLKKAESYFNGAIIDHSLKIGI